MSISITQYWLLFMTGVSMLFFSMLEKSYAEEFETQQNNYNIESLERYLETERHKPLVNQKTQTKAELSAFSSDGCSGGLSIGWEYMADKLPSFQHRLGNLPPWEACCIIHDRVYHAAGDKYADINESFKQRRAADRALEMCVIETGIQQRQQLLDDYGLSAQDVKRLYAAIAALMYRAVRIGGVPCSGLPWRWGYGWPKCE